MKARIRAFILSMLLPMAVYGQDVALLRIAPSSRGGVGTAQVYGGYEEGGYRPAFAPSSLWKAGASASGIMHTGRTTFRGSFSFEQVEGKDMFTSMFLEPGYFPVDVVEFTPGSKTRQTYKLGGGFATDISRNLVVGLDASYNAANYSKRKDIRHTTYGMDLHLKPTLCMKMYDGAGLSFAYLFRKRTESIDAEQVGAATDQSYYAFLDKGMRYGTYQVWDGDGIHLDEAGVGVFPVTEYTHGFAYTLKIPQFSGGMEVLWKHGKVGEKGYDWFRYPGRSVSLFMEKGFGAHTLRLDMDIHEDQLLEAVMDKDTEGGVTTPHIYGYNAVSDRTWSNIGLKYSVALPWRGFPGFNAVLRGTAWTENSYLMYPYEDSNVRYNGMLTLRFMFAPGPLIMAIDLKGGMGSWAEEGLHGGTQDVLTEPFRLQADWDRKMEFFSTSRAGAGLSLRYDMKRIRGMYISAEGTYMHGFGVVLLPGANRWSATLKTGYNFKLK